MQNKYMKHQPGMKHAKGYDGKGRYELSERQALERAILAARMTRNFSPSTWINGTRENEVYRRTTAKKFRDDGIGEDTITDEINRMMDTEEFMNS